MTDKVLFSIKNCLLKIHSHSQADLKRNWEPMAKTGRLKTSVYLMCSPDSI